jgi:hypothetical protein
MHFRWLLFNFFLNNEIRISSIIAPWCRTFISLCQEIAACRAAQGRAQFSPHDAEALAAPLYGARYQWSLN